MVRRSDTNRDELRGRGQTMRGWLRSRFLGALLGVTLLAPAPALAQVQSIDPSRLRNLMGTPNTNPNARADAEPDLSITESYGSFLDSAVPRNTVRLRLDLGYHDHRPTRAEYFLGKNGLAAP